MEIMSEALYLSFLLAGPMLIISMIVGLIIAVMQAATQIHEQTLTFVPKLLVIAVTLLVTGPWMMDSLEDFMNRLFTFIATHV
jgi:flagellar biosynthetic protein FliQ